MGFILGAVLSGAVATIAQDGVLPWWYFNLDTRITRLEQAAKFPR